MRQTAGHARLEGQDPVLAWESRERPVDTAIGARLERLAALAPLFPGRRASVAVVRYDGRLFWSVTDDWDGPARGARLAADLERELARACASFDGRGAPAASFEPPTGEATA